MLYSKNKRNKNIANKSNRARNMYAIQPKSNEIKTTNIPEPEINIQIPENAQTGYLNVGVYTALGALPVSNAVITVYIIDENGEEEALYILITDGNGRVQTITLPVAYNPSDPAESPEYYFTNYNMRVEAENYNTFNVRQLRIFPGISTDYNVNLVPVLPGAPSDIKEYDLTIPPMPIDRSNE